METVEGQRRQKLEGARALLVLLAEALGRGLGLSEEGGIVLLNELEEELTVLVEEGRGRDEPANTVGPERGISSNCHLREGGEEG